MSTSNAFGLLYGDDAETYNKQVTNKEPSFLTGSARDDHEQGMYDDVISALEIQVKKAKPNAEQELQDYQAWYDRRNKLNDDARKALKAVSKAAKQAGSGPGTPLSDKDDLRYRMEKLDEKKHRMGDYLQGAYDEFVGEANKLENPNFFRWVEEKIKGEGIAAAERWHSDLFKNANPQQKAKYFQWFTEGVNYLTDEPQRNRYKVAIEEGELKRRKAKEKQGSIDKFDSQELVDHFKGKNDNVSGNCIWVMSPTGNFYTHISKVGRFHHSSLRGGENVEAAGEWKVQNGKLVEIDGTTGHYKVERAGFINAVKSLAAQKALQADTKVILYEPDGKKVPVSAQDFAANPDQFNGKLTFNPKRHGQV